MKVNRIPHPILLRRALDPGCLRSSYKLAQGIVSHTIDPPTLSPDQDLLRLVGEVDLAQQPSMVADIESRLRQHPQLIIDLTAVTFIDCTGLGTLLSARTHAEDFGGHLSLVGPCAALSRILELTSLGELLPLHPDVSAARAHVPQPRSA